MNAWQALCLICACLSDRDAAPGPDEALAARVADDGIDWENVFRIANLNYALPAMYCRLRDKGALGGLNPGVRDCLAELHRLNRQRNRRIFKTMTWVDGLFAGAGIKAVWIKGGAYLAAKVFRDPGEPLMLDLDVLVAQADLAGAVEVFETSGFEAMADWPGNEHHITPYRHEKSPVRIETHHAVVYPEFQHLLPAEEVLAEAGKGIGPGRALHVPCPTHMALINVIETMMGNPDGLAIQKCYALTRIARRFGRRIDWSRAAAAFDRESDAWIFSDMMLAAYLLYDWRIPGTPRPDPLASLPDANRLYEKLRLCL